MFFNNSFKKVFVATQVSGAGAGQNNNVNLSNGFVITAGLSTAILNQTSATANSNYGVGSFGLFDATTYLSRTTFTNCCPLILAGAGLYSQDSISPFIGGINETNKSKKIVPKYITAFRRIDPCTPQAQVTHLGNTKYTKTLSPVNALCSHDFLCGETYTLRIDVRNAPALRLLNHQAYRTVDYYTGCCPSTNPVALVDSTLVMIGWADKIVNDPILKYFISPIVYSEAGVAYYAPGNSALNTPTWDNYVSPGHVVGQTAGIRFQGAYVETTFSNCTFQYSDYWNVEPVLMKFTMMDFNGDPCEFSNICTVDECGGIMVNGTGEQATRDLIMSESYRQSYLATDLRIREVTLGNQIVATLDRTKLYTRYQIQHNVPRHNNPTSTFDQDQYDLNIITPTANAAFEAAMATWLTNCANCTSLAIDSCIPCTILTP